ncbi:hypothetical protein JNM87_00210 [Candidatus Saccharibacteria bacterium]|nr:hypothetical protein [Candidatus Saccharibacteria bacterium]
MTIHDSSDPKRDLLFRIFGERLNGLHYDVMGVFGMHTDEEASIVLGKALSRLVMQPNDTMHPIKGMFIMVNTEPTDELTPRSVSNATFEYPGKFDGTISQIRTATIEAFRTLISARLLIDVHTNKGKESFGICKVGATQRPEIARILSAVYPPGRDEYPVLSFSSNHPAAQIPNYAGLDLHPTSELLDPQAMLQLFIRAARDKLPPAKNLVEYTNICSLRTTTLKSLGRIASDVWQPMAFGEPLSAALTDKLGFPPLPNGDPYVACGWDPVAYYATGFAGEICVRACHEQTVRSSFDCPTVM